MVNFFFEMSKKNFFLNRKQIHIKSGTHRTTFLYRRKKLRPSPVHLLTKFGIDRKKTANRGFYEVFNERWEKSGKNRKVD